MALVSHTQDLEKIVGKHTLLGAVQMDGLDVKLRSCWEAYLYVNGNAVVGI